MRFISSLRSCVSLPIFIACLTAWVLPAAHGEDLIDACGTAEHFFLLPGEKNVAAIKATDGRVELRKSGAGDAFIRWSSAEPQMTPLDDTHRWLSIRFDKFTAAGTKAAVNVQFYQNKKRLELAELWTVSGPAMISTDLRKLNAEATHFSLFIRHGGDAKGAVRIDEIRLGSLEYVVPAAIQAAVESKEELPPVPVKKIEVAVETGDIIPVVTPENGSKVALVVSNPGKERIDLTVHLDIEDYDHRRSILESNLTLEAGASSRMAPLFDGKTRGVYVIHYTLTDRASGEKAEGLTSFCCMTPAGPGPFRREGFLFSANGGPKGKGDEEDLRRVTRAISLAGIKVIRDSLPWEGVQYAGPDKWDKRSLTRHGHMLDVLKESGLEMQMLLGYNTPWNMPPGTGKRPDRSEWQFNPPQKGDIKNWLGYVDKVVGTFGDRVRYWEVWNESDLWDFWQGSSAEYLTLLEATYKAVKAHDAQHQVMTSGFALIGGHGGHREEDFQKKVCIQGRPFYDILAHHQHGRTEEFYKAVDGGLAEIRREVEPPAPLWFNETASNTPIDGYRLQAAALVRKLLFAWSRGAIGYTWYQTRTGTLDVDSKRRWGLMSEKLEPKFAYAAYNTLIGLLDDKDFDAELKRGPERYGFLFKQRSGGGEYVVGLWDEQEKRNEEPVTFSIGEVAGAFAVDLMGNRTPLAVRDGVTVIPSGPYPRFLLVQGAAQPPQLLKPLVFVGHPLPLAVPGRPCAIATKLSNPLDHELDLELIWSGLPGAAPEQKTTIRLPAKASTDRVFDIPFPVGFQIPSGDLHKLRLSFSAPDAGWSGHLQVPVEPALLIPSGSMEDRTADLQLDEDRYVTNLHENVPQREHLTWQGPADLGAKIWLQRDRDFLRVRVDVRDDHHHATPDNPGDADSVGLVLANPNSKGQWVIYGVRSDAGLDSVKILKSPGATKPGGIALKTTPIADGLRYDFALPLAALGLDDTALAAGRPFNVIVVDRDQGDREGWIQIAPAKVHWAPNWDASTFSKAIFETGAP